jgi:dipeptidyl aminopeptidase/acylaminoacyl peptidase
MRFTLFTGITALLCCPFLVSAVSLLPHQLLSDAGPSPEVSLQQSYDCFSGPIGDEKLFSQQLEQHNYANWQGYIGFSSKNDYVDIVASVRCEVLHYLVDGTQVEAVLMYPKQADKLPVILYNRGGNRDLSAMNFSGVARVLNFVRQGYLVIASNYRGTDSWPLYNTEGSVELAPQPIGKDEYGGQDVDDVVALLQLLKGYPQADSSRIGLYGVSRGGMMAFQVASRLPEVKAMVIKSGAYDLAALRRPRPGMEKLFRQLIPGYTGQSTRLLDQRSPRYVIHKLKQNLPILMLHGDQDDRVEVEQATQMAELLKQQNRPHTLVLYPRGDHYLRSFGKQVDQEIVAWLKQYL